MPVYANSVSPFTGVLSLCLFHVTTELSFAQGSRFQSTFRRGQLVTLANPRWSVSLGLFGHMANYPKEPSFFAVSCEWFSKELHYGALVPIDARYRFMVRKLRYIHPGA